MEDESGGQGGTIRMRIRTLYPHEQELNVELSTEATTDDLKAELEQRTGVSASSQRLIHRGRVLEGGCRLMDSGVADNHTVHMVSRPPDTRPSGRQGEGAMETEGQQSGQGQGQNVDLMTGLVGGGLAPPGSLISHFAVELGVPRASNENAQEEREQQAPLQHLETFLTNLNASLTEMAQRCDQLPNQESHPSLGTTHSEVTCDGCNQGPIIGRRYKSLSTSDYDLCERCYSENRGVQGNEPFTCLPLPMPWPTCGNPERRIENVRERRRNEEQTNTDDQLRLPGGAAEATFGEVSESLRSLIEVYGRLGDLLRGAERAASSEPHLSGDDRRDAQSAVMQASCALHSFGAAALEAARTLSGVLLSDEPGSGAVLVGPSSYLSHSGRTPTVPTPIATSAYGTFSGDIVSALYGRSGGDGEQSGRTSHRQEHNQQGRGTTSMGHAEAPARLLTTDDSMFSTGANQHANTNTNQQQQHQQQRQYQEQQQQEEAQAPRQLRITRNIHVAFPFGGQSSGLGLASTPQQHRARQVHQQETQQHQQQQAGQQQHQQQHEVDATNELMQALRRFSTRQTPGETSSTASHASSGTSQAGEALTEHDDTTRGSIREALNHVTELLHSQMEDSHEQRRTREVLQLVRLLLRRLLNEEHVPAVNATDRATQTDDEGTNDAKGKRADSSQQGAAPTGLAGGGLPSKGVKRKNKKADDNAAKPKQPAQVARDNTPSTAQGSNHQRQASPMQSIMEQVMGGGGGRNMGQMLSQVAQSEDFQRMASQLLGGSGLGDLMAGRDGAGGQQRRRQGRRSASQWREELPSERINHWERVMEADAREQARMKPQADLSPAYLSGRFHHSRSSQ